MPQLHQIGPNLFRNFIGTPPPGRVQQTVEVISVPGVDNSILRRMGRRSSVYTFDTIVDCLTGDLAEFEFSLYDTNVGAPPAKLVWNSYDYDRLKLRLAVIRVDLVGINRNVAICGGLRGGVWDLRARWHGILVPFD